MLPFYEFHNTLMRADKVQSIDFPSHLHKDIELLYVREGIVETQIGQDIFSVHRGEMIIIFPYCVHSYKTLEKSKCDLLIFRDDLSKELENIFESKIPVNPVISEFDEELIYIMTKLTSFDIEKCDNLVLKSYFQLFWAMILSKQNLIHREISDSDNLSEKIIEYMTSNFTEKITLETLSKTFGVSRYKISRIFSATIGMPFFHYLNAMRIDKAKGMLQNKNHDIITVAYECGFDSQQTFNRVFKEQCGITPRDFRKTLKA